MKIATLFFMLAIPLLTGCTSSSEVKEEAGSKSPEQMRLSLTAFIEGYPWQRYEAERHPVFSANRAELARLKAAWAGSGDEHRIVADRVARADEALKEGLIFPPEGGQHNQWYQCNVCQRGLVTVDAHHHKCPQCGKVYSGFPYDNVLFSDRHRENFSLAEDAAWAWVVTGNKKYAGLAAEILKGYSDRYLKYRMVDAGVSDSTIDVAAEKNGRFRSAGHIMSQTLDEAMLMIPAVMAYDLIYDSKVLKKDDRKQILEGLIRPMSECINVNKTGRSNWQTWHNTALMYAGIVLGDKQMVKQAVLDDENGFVTQMKISVLPEGMWYENSWGYHYYTLSALTIMAEGGRRIGMDFYSDETLRKMYLLAFDYRMADGSLPRFGDAVDDSPDNQSVNEQAYAAYKDSRLLSALPAGPTWDMIMAGRKPGTTVEKVNPVSKLIPGSGHAILATDGPGRLTAAITFGPYGGFHGHYDKLSFVFFGYGQELAVDPGRAASQAYRLPIHSEWYKATTGHNDILVDGKPQKEAGGKLLAFDANLSYAAVAADAGPAFGNVSQRRFLLLAPTYLLVIDELKTLDGQQHSFDWLYHNKGVNALCDLPGSGASPGEIPPGYAYLKDVKSFKEVSDAPFVVKFESDKVTTRLTMLGHRGDEVFTATGPFSGIVDRIPVAIVRRKGKLMYFITVLEPVSPKDQPDVRGMSLVPGSNMSVRIVRSNGEDIVSFEREGLDRFTVRGKSGSSALSAILSAGSAK